MIETVALYTCDLCFRAQWVKVLDSLGQNWTIIPIVNPLHLCPQCSGLAQRFLSVLSIPFDFEDREHIGKTRFNILKVRDLSVLFPKPCRGVVKGAQTAQMQPTQNAVQSPFADHIPGLQAQPEQDEGIEHLEGPKEKGE